MRSTLLGAVAAVVMTSACSVTPASSPAPIPNAVAEPSSERQPSDAPPSAPSAGLQWRTLSSEARTVKTGVRGGQLTMSESRQQVRLNTRTVNLEISAGAGRRFDEVLVSPPYVVVVAEDTLEERSATARVIDLRNGDVRRMDVGGVPRLTTGGSWAAAAGSVAYPSRRGNDYCIALVDLASLKGDLRHCVPPGNGLSQFNMSDVALGFMSFDNRRPVACRAVNVMEGSADVFDQAEDCKPWEIAQLADGSVIWSEIVKERMIEQARFFSRDASGEVTDLGTGITGSLAWCDGAAYFSRNPGEDVGYGQLLRWSPGKGLEEAYRTKRSSAVTVGPARCAGNALSLSVYTNGAGSQVTAVTN